MVYVDEEFEDGEGGYSRKRTVDTEGEPAAVHATPDGDIYVVPMRPGLVRVRPDNAICLPAPKREAV